MWEILFAGSLWLPNTILSFLPWFFNFSSPSLFNLWGRGLRVIKKGKGSGSHKFLLLVFGSLFSNFPCPLLLNISTPNPLFLIALTHRGLELPQFRYWVPSLVHWTSNPVTAMQHEHPSLPHPNVALMHRRFAPPSIHRHLENHLSSSHHSFQCYSSIH